MAKEVTMAAGQGRGLEKEGAGGGTHVQRKGRLEGTVAGRRGSRVVGLDRGSGGWVGWRERERIEGRGFEVRTKCGGKEEGDMILFIYDYRRNLPMAFSVDNTYRWKSGSTDGPFQIWSNATFHTRAGNF